MLRVPVVLALTVVVAAAAVAVLVAHGGGDKKLKADAPKAADKASPSQRRLVPFDEFRKVPLDSARATIEGRFGAPLHTAPAGALDPGANCLFYAAPADAAPATEYQLCFVAGKLHSKFAG